MNERVGSLAPLQLISQYRTGRLLSVENCVVHKTDGRHSR